MTSSDYSLGWSRNTSNETEGHIADLPETGGTLGSHKVEGKSNKEKIVAALIVIVALAVIGYSLSTISEVRTGASWMWRQVGYGADYATQGVKYIWRQMGYGVNYTGQGMGYLWRQIGYGATAAGHFLSSPAFLNGLKWTGIGIGGLIVVCGIGFKAKKVIQQRHADAGAKALEQNRFNLLDPQDADSDDDAEGLGVEVKPIRTFLQWLRGVQAPVREPDQDL